jgi:sodium/pantothenate symporter
MLGVQVIFFIYLALMVLIGVLAARYVRRETFLTDFYTAGRRLGPFIVGLTAVSAFASGGTLIATPGLVYQQGLTAILWQSAGFAYALVIIGVVGKRVAQLAHRFGAVSLPDIFQRRFGGRMALVCTLLIIFLLFPYMGAQFIGVARVLQAVVGLDYTLAVFITSGVILLYVSLGGMLAQAWTNVIQSILMIVAVLIGVTVVLVHFDGFAPMTQAFIDRGPEYVGPPGPDNFLPVGLAISYGIMLIGFGAFGAPHVVSRFYALRSGVNFSHVMAVGSIAVALWFPLLLIIGMGSVAMFPSLEHSDLAFPQVAIELLPPLLAGLVLAGIAAAMMSTVDAMLMTVSVSVTRDLFNRFKPDASSQLLRWVGLVVTAVAAVGAALVALNPPEFLLAIVLFALGGMGATFAVPLFAALYWPRATTEAGLWAMVTGFVVTVLFHIPALEHPLGFHAVGWGILASIAAMVAVTYVTKPPAQSVVQEFYGVDRSSEG